MLRDRLAKLAVARWAHVEEEWTYEDPESGTLRAADAMAEAALWEFGQRGENPRIRPTLNLIVECKQSELPYVFFTREEAEGGDFAVTSGFPHNTITGAGPTPNPPQSACPRSADDRIRQGHIHPPAATVR